MILFEAYLRSTRVFWFQCIAEEESTTNQITCCSTISARRFCAVSVLILVYIHWLLCTLNCMLYNFLLPFVKLVFYPFILAYNVLYTCPYTFLFSCYLNQTTNQNILLTVNLYFTAHFVAWLHLLLILFELNEWNI